jgi:ubiquinone/menaquinone biosynthesis C-methylase UbiE
MLTPSRRREQPSTYFVQDRESEKELTRLAIQDHLITAKMGGVLSEQLNPTALHRVLDVGCGTGGWVIEAAQTYPTMSLIGIDISQRMIEYARDRAQTHLINDRVEFHVMDALLFLEFPVAYFDLVNMRLGSAFMRTWEWPKMLRELRRVTNPKGIVRVTDCEIIQSNSPALTLFNEMLQCALFRAGHHFTERTALPPHLVQLLSQHGCKDVQTKASTIEYRGGTTEGEAFSEDMKLAFQTLRPFLEKWGCAARDYEAIYQQACTELRQPNFHATWNFLTAWGKSAAEVNRNLNR